MGTYRSIHKLAAGGMAEVFLGKVVGAEGFEKPVAVKRILPSYVQEAAFNELFLREAKVSMLLQHANVVQVLDLGTVGGQYYMVMEFVEGESLRALLKASKNRKVPLGLREVCFIAQQVADGLAYAHTRTDSSGAPLNIVHRDVNPSNVMIGINGEVKLADFGIAKVADGHIETQAGVLKGKINYLSPEQVTGKSVDQRSDIFLLGLLLHELLSGKQLLEGSHLQIVQRLGSFNERALDPLPGVPAPLWAILQRALAFSPTARFRTAREFSEALQSFLFDHRLRVGSSDISALFARAFPERRSPLEDLAGSRGEEIHLDGRDTPRAVAPPVLRPEPRRPAPAVNPPQLRPQLQPAPSGRGAERDYIDGEELEAQSRRHSEPPPAPTPSPAPPQAAPVVSAPAVPPTPAPPPVVRTASAASMPRARMVLVVADASEACDAAVKLLLQQGIAAASGPAATAEKALALGGYDLVLVVESAVEKPAALAERLRTSHPEVAVRSLPSFSAALLGEGGPLERMLSTQSRLLEGALSMLGGSGGLAPLLVKLTRRCASRLGAGSIEELLAGTAAAALLLAARLEEPAHFVLPSLAHARTLVGGDLPELSEILGAVLTEGANVGPPTDRVALAVLSATAFVLQTQSAQPTPKEAAEALISLRQSPRLTPAALEVLAVELGIGLAGSGSAPRVVVADSDATTAMTLQLRLMAEGLVMQRTRTLAEVERALPGAHAAILESPLPDGDLYTFIEHLRATPATARFPLFLIVTREDPAVVTAGLDAGADDVLVRPVNVEVLMAKLRRALGQRQASQRA